MNGQYYRTIRHVPSFRAQKNAKFKKSTNLESGGINIEIGHVFILQYKQLFNH